MPKDAQSFTLTTAALPGMLSAGFSGTASGSFQFLAQVNKATAVLSENSSQRDSLLKSLQVLFEDNPQMDHSFLETYLPELKAGLIAIHDCVGAIVRNALLGLYSGVGHLSQIPLDLATVASRTADGLTHLEIPTNLIQAAIKNAFTFEVNNKKSSASTHVVGDVLGNLGAGIENGIKENIHIGGNSHAETHARLANSIGASSIITTAIPPLAVGLATDIVGQVFREGTGLSHFSAQEFLSNAPENVYHASNEVSKATQNTNIHESIERTRELELALSAINPAAQLLSDQKVSTPLSTALFRLVALSLFVESSQGISKTAQIMTEGQIQKALSDATAQNPSGGVDRIKSLHSNLSSLSNIMRLCAENLGGAPAIKTLAQSCEVISSRSITVLLSNISALAEALGQLVSPQENDLSKSPACTVEMANPQILAQSEAIIKDALDRIEQEHNQHIIPDLNRDMARQLQTSSYSGVASLLATHSVFSNPIILAVKGSKQASQIKDDQKNEALMATLPSVTQALNAIQAFTQNLMTEMQKEMRSEFTQTKGPLLSTHGTVASNTAVVYWSVSAISLICDEMISICRSMTLIDQNRLQAALQKASAVPSAEESQQSSEQVAWDSHAEQNDSITHAIPALRLTLSHLGIALMKIALELHQALKDNLNTVQENMAMNTLQQKLLISSAYAAEYFAEGLLFSTGSASAFPVSLNGSVNELQKILHSTDAHLHPAQTNSSEQSSHELSPTSQAIGFSTDLLANTVTNVLKVLAQGGLIGLDTTLKLIKILEIISLHRDSHIALHLETNKSSHPNGLLKNTLTEPSVGSCAGIGAILMNLLEAFQNFDRSCGTRSTLNAQDRLKEVIDNHIEGLAILKDDEEDRDNKIGLKGFYKILIRLLSEGTESDHDSLIKRLDFGGISLSNYHSLFGAYNEQPAADLRFINGFANDDDAQGILRQFIDKTKQQFSLLKLLHNALPQDRKSSKVQSLYEHIFEEVYQHYKQIKMSDIAQFSTSRRRVPTRDTFITDLGLESVALRIDEDAPANSLSLR